MRPQDMLDALKDALMTLELQTVEILQELLEAFDRNYSSLAEQVKQSVMQYVTTLRELESTFSANLITLAQKLYDDKYASEVRVALAAAAAGAGRTTPCLAQLLPAANILPQRHRAAVTLGAPFSGG